ncbi:retrovirus-related pol polyprotein from transposon TNT 1-94 [Tanacetum coccineum]
MSGTVPPISPPLGASTGSSGSPNVNRVDTMPTTETINTTTTTNVGRNVDEDLPQLLDSRAGSHVSNIPTFDKEDFSRSFDTRDTKIAALRLKFNTCKALEGEKVNDTYTRLKCLLNDLKNNGVFISQAEVNATTTMKKTSNEFMANLNADYQERGLLANQKRFYKRSRRVGLARKPIDKSKKACFTCGKLGHFQKDFPSNKISTPSYPSSNTSFNKPKPYTPSFTQNSSQNIRNHQKDYKGKYKGLKAKMVVLTQRIDDLRKCKSDKRKGDKGKSEKGLIAESFNWDDESVSLEDKDTTRFKAFMVIAEDDPSVGKTNARSIKALGGKGRRKENNSSKEVVFTKADESSSEPIPEITSDFEADCDTYKPLPALPKLIGA